MELHYLAQNPFQQFHDWFKEAEVGANVSFPTAMALATVSAAGRPSVRMVLLKGVSAEGFAFYTNYEGRKARELAENPKAALCFYWDKLSRQVRVEGVVEKISRAESEAYFRTRPRLSQLGAWASPQSEEIPSRAFLEERLREVTARFQGKEVPLPEFWGGYLLRPDYFEFWQQGEGRLHDRFVYEPGGSSGRGGGQSGGQSAGIDVLGAGWRVKRLAP